MDGTMLSLGQIRDGLSSYSPRSVVGSRDMSQAAVALVLRESADREAEVLMISRAVRTGDPWSGHMGFPGGRLEPVDRSARDAAVRETMEELGLRLERAGCLVGQLSALQARSRHGPLPLCIHPYVFELVEDPGLELNAEVEEAVWIPISFFSTPANRGSLTLREPAGERVLPSYHFGEKTVWGLSLKMLDELVFDVCGIVFPD